MKIFSYKEPPFFQKEFNGYKLKTHQFQKAEDIYGMWDNCSPEEADYIFVPFIFYANSISPDIDEVAMKFFTEQLKWFNQFPEKHIILDISDLDLPCKCLAQSIVFKTSANIRYHDIYSLPYYTQPIRYAPPVTSAIYDLCFQGSLATHPIRKEMAKWVPTWAEYKVNFIENDLQFWSFNKDKQAVLQSSFKQQIKDSVFVLCPRGRALNSVRFFETLSCGRIPILITDAAKLPLESIIDYSKFCVFIPEGYCRWIPDFIKDFLERNSIVEASKIARNVYDTYFDPSQFRNLLTATINFERK
ncbi:MAG TPA: exostosin family protein [Segetibacter sp.]|jgi:hypothetical protein